MLAQLLGSSVTAMRLFLMPFGGSAATEMTYQLIETANIRTTCVVGANTRQSHLQLSLEKALGSEIEILFRGDVCISGRSRRAVEFRRKVPAELFHFTLLAQIEPGQSLHAKGVKISRLTNRDSNAVYWAQWPEPQSEFLQFEIPLEAPDAWRRIQVPTMINGQSVTLVGQLRKIENP